MIALIVILVLLLIINLVPFGVDGGYEDGAAFASAVIGPFRMKLLPQPEKSEEEKRLAQEKKRLKKEAKAAKKQRKKERQAAKRLKKGLPPEPEKQKKKPDLDFIFAVAGMGLRALKRFRHRLSADLFKLHFTAGGDPYSAAMMYGYVSAAFGTVLPFLDDAFCIHERDVEVGVDFDSGQTRIDARLILTIQLWEVMYVALAFLAEFIRYKTSNRRKAEPADKETPDAA